MERYLELRRQKDSQVPMVRFAPIKEEEKQSEPQLSERFRTALRSYEERDTPKRWMEY